MRCCYHTKHQFRTTPVTDTNRMPDQKGGYKQTPNKCRMGRMRTDLNKQKHVIQVGMGRWPACLGHGASHENRQPSSKKNNRSINISWFKVLIPSKPFRQGFMRGVLDGGRESNLFFYHKRLYMYIYINHWPEWKVLSSSDALGPMLVPTPIAAANVDVIVASGKKGLWQNHGSVYMQRHICAKNRAW